MLLSGVASAQSLETIAVQFEQSLYCGQRIWSKEETASFMRAAVSFAPHLAANPRIAGTKGVIATTPRGYYGGVFLGPIRVSERELRYDWMTIWGGLDHPWAFLPSETYRGVLIDEHPTWLLLVDTSLQDDIEVTAAQATTVIRLSKELSGLSPAEIQKLHRFEISLFSPPDIILTESTREVPWWEGHFVITAKSQDPGSHTGVYDAGVQFAVTDQGLKFIRSIPAFDVFEEHHLRRRVCDLPEP
ncbi:MAG: hypothetical protein AAF648_10650 [Pseudomonadota bacterium]